MILAADVGGTNARIALLDAQGGQRPAVRVLETFPSRAHQSLEQIVARFLSANPSRIEAACVAVAGPVSEECAVVTNLPWKIDAKELARRLSLPHVGLINDVQANAWGISALSEQDFVSLNEGRAVPDTAAAVLSAGTGLGQAGLFWSGDEHVPMASEGGHADFAPRNRLEIELLEYLQERLGKRVSYERVLSGPGLVNLYSFLRDSGRAQEPEWLAKRLASGDAAAEISAAASTCSLAERALDLLVSIYGAAAGTRGAALHGHRRPLPRGRHRAQDRAPAERPDLPRCLPRQRPVESAARADPRPGDHERQGRPRRCGPLCMAPVAGTRVRPLMVAIPRALLRRM